MGLAFMSMGIAPVVVPTRIRTGRSGQKRLVSDTPQTRGSSVKTLVVSMLSSGMKVQG